MDQVDAAIDNALQQIHIPFLHTPYVWLQKYFGWLECACFPAVLFSACCCCSFVSSIGVTWNCGGALSMITPVVLFLGAFASSCRATSSVRTGAVFLVVLLQRDLLMQLGVRFRGKTVGHGFAYKTTRKKIADVLTILAMMALQSAVVRRRLLIFTPFQRVFFGDR